MLSVRKGKKCLCKDKTGTISRKRVVTRVMTIPPATQCTVHSAEKLHSAQWRKATQRCTVQSGENLHSSTVHSGEKPYAVEKSYTAVHSAQWRKSCMQCRAEQQGVAHGRPAKSHNIVLLQ